MGLARVIRYHTLCIMKPINFLFIVLAFLINALLVYSVYCEAIPTGNIQAAAFMFYLPINLPFDLFRWILVLLPILLIVGSFINNEINERSSYSLLQMKSFHRWFHSLIIVCFFSTVVTFIVGFTVTGAVVSITPREIVSDKWINSFTLLYTSNEWTLLVHQFFLLVLSVFLIVLLKILFTFLVDNSSFSFLLTIIFSVTSIVVGNAYPSILKWLPLTYGLFVFQEINDYSFIWSYVCLMISLLIVYIFTFIVFIIHKESLFMNKLE
jgi:hypothetical protein